jgi:hypothetical protein
MYRHSLCPAGWAEAIASGQKARKRLSIIGCGTKLEQPKVEVDEACRARIECSSSAGCGFTLCGLNA